MPPSGFTTITVPEYLLDRLDTFRDDDGGRGGYAETIERLIDRVEADDGTDALTRQEFEDTMYEIAADISNTTAIKAADEIESRLR